MKTQGSAMPRKIPGWRPDRRTDAPGERTRTVLLALLAIATLVALAPGARAQTPSPLAEWQYSAGIPLEKMFQEQAPAWRIDLGVASALEPLYDGAQRYWVVGGPTVDIRYHDLFFASTGEGIGVNVLRGRTWRAGVALTYDLGRRAASYDSHLHGLGNISPSPDVKLFADYAVSKRFPLVLRADVRRNLGGSDGWIGDLGAYMPMPGSSERFYWFAGPSVTFADANYMNRWFGISQSQSVLSGYSRYKAHAGMKSFGFGVTAVWFFRKYWFLNVDVAVEQLVGSAAHSPITESETNGTFDVSVAYQF